MHKISTQLFGRVLPKKYIEREKKFYIMSFEYDSVEIAWIQQDVYWDVISDLYKIAKRIYHHGEIVVGITTQLTKDSWDKNGFDHRTLQFLHNMIAEQFRYEYIFYECEGPLFHTFDNSCEEKERVLLLWKKFYPKEIERLVEKHPFFARLILTSATYPNPDERGIEAEEDIFDLLRQEYQFRC